MFGNTLSAVNPVVPVSDASRGEQKPKLDVVVVDDRADGNL